MLVKPLSAGLAVIVLKLSFLQQHIKVEEILLKIGKFDGESQFICLETCQIALRFSIKTTKITLPETKTAQL